MAIDNQTVVSRSAEDGSLRRLSRVLLESPIQFGTCRLEEARKHLQSQDSSIDLQIHDLKGFRGYSERRLVPLPTVALSLGCIDSGTGYELAFQSRDQMLVNIPLCGRGWVSTGTQNFEMRPGQILLLGPSCRVIKHWEGPGQVLSLHIPLTTLSQYFDAAQPQGRPLYLPPVTLMDHTRLQTLLGFVELLLHDRSGSHGLGGQSTARHAESLLIALLVDGFELKAEPGPGPAESACAKPYYVRRTEEYLRANTGTEMGINELAEVAGVSRRTLQYGFQKVHGTSPTLYAKRMRFEQAREELRTAVQNGRRVSEIAADIGCFNISQFSRDYRALFGESPSETVASPRLLCAAVD